ncbi:restriction endonuclease subunit S [Fulvivirga sp. 29W222]|uniref:Restriction endonuclease subunit S n=1 Tax=Fulvivirga marina TaxID=2494733 RepID=A0A937FUI4_9BACT|nr:restriction endonuclease subunit S [Fulvivirga marina]MBL6444702.1 restriction endonuclease subunit S [Fulvivirga marina]
MKSVKVKKNWLVNSGVRFDASYHLSDGVKTKWIIDNFCPYPKTTIEKESKELYKGNIHKRVYVDSPTNGNQFYSASDLFKQDLDSGKFVSKKYSPHLKELELKKDWILITRSGTLGKVVCTTSDHEGKTGTDDLVRINPKENKIKRGVLYALLSSKFGYGLLTQSSYGGVVKHIEPDHVGSIEIPIFPDKNQFEIDQLVKDSLNSRVEANKLLKTAHAYFDEILSLNTPLPKTYQKFSSELSLFHNRLDASFNIYKKELDAVVKNCGYSFTKFENHIESIFIPNRGKRVYVKHGLKYLSTTDLFSINPLRINKYLSFKMNGIETLQVKKNWILIARSGQEILGSTFLVGDSINKLGVNEHALRVIVDESEAHYIYGFLSSSFGKSYLRAGIFGSAILTINDDYIKELLIPELDNGKKAKVKALVSKATELLDQAIINENKAIELVENEIESWQKS